jgi:hypothetical protein
LTVTRQPVALDRDGRPVAVILDIDSHEEAENAASAPVTPS